MGPSAVLIIHIAGSFWARSSGLPPCSISESSCSAVCRANERLRDPGITMKIRFVAVSALIVSCCSAAHAHHSSAAFETDSKVSIEGVVLGFDWVNPHVYIELEQADEAGEGRVWLIEGQSPAFLRRIGWTSESISIGDRVTVTGSPGRDPDERILLLDALERSSDASLQADQLSFGIAIMAPPSESIPALGLDGIWATQVSPEAIAATMSTGTMDLTDSAREALASFSPADNPAIRCIPLPAPAMMIAPDIKSIEVRDDVVLIRGEFDASERIVHLSADSHEAASPSIQGHSIGYFDGDALVIDTAEFSPHRTSLSVAIPSSENKHLVERLELSDDRTHLIYSFELEDPEYLATPIAVQGVQWWHRPDLDFSAVPCDIRNARRFIDR